LKLARSAPQAAVALAQRAAAHGDERSAPLWLADAADVAARAALARGDMHAALHEARRAAGLSHVAQATPAYAMTYRLNEGYALLGLGAWDDAVALMRELATIDLPERLTERIQLLVALFALVRDDRCASWNGVSQVVLQASLRRLRELDWPDVLALLPQTIGRLWVRALDAGIEPDWIRAAIVARNLPPPQAVATPAWPWAARVHVLGPFVLEVAGHQPPAADAGKASAKPLALLRRIAIEAGYDGAPADTLAEALWPGEGREGRGKAMEITLARLRKLLGHADAVLLHERRLRLNPQRVWLDSAALAAQLDAAAVDAPQVLALWRGTLLAGEPDDAWLAAYRQRWRMRIAAWLLAQPASNKALALRACAADPALADLLA
jgi:DNA-binding SARP family transcriptional activator